MKAPIALALLAILAFAISPATARADRACRPSLSNLYHCPDTSNPAAKPTRTTTSSGRTCHPSVSNLWACPDTSKPSRSSSGTGRACRPSLSNGYSCPGTASKDQGPAPAKKTASTPEPDRACRPSLSNGYKCPGDKGTTAATGANQYSSERAARAHCSSDSVVWANTGTNVYHFKGTFRYGNTVAGAYMCEQDSLAEGMRAAKNETHP
jgi:hypothetical protein